MSYTKHNYKKGDELLASQLNDMDDQIALNEQTADTLVTVSNTEPTAEKNRVWVKATPSEIEIPTMDDHNELSRQISDVDSTITQLTKIYPQNYVDTNAESCFVGTSGLIGKVTVTGNTQSGLYVTNTAGINGDLAIPLDNLPYEAPKAIKFSVSVDGGKAPITIFLRRSMREGGYGVDIASFSLGESGNYELTYNLAIYDYATYGKLYIAYNLRYNQTTPVKLEILALPSGKNQKLIIDENALENIGFDNLSEDLQSSIINGSNYPTLYNGKEICTFNKGVAIGDSLTIGVFNTNDGGVTGYETYSAFSYPAKLKQMTGIDMTNLGEGGYTAARWWDVHGNDDFSGNQFAIIQLGVNDAANGWTQTVIDAFTNIINKLLADVNGIFVFVSTIIPATSYSGQTFDAISDGIRTLVETINNDHVILLDMAEYGNTKNKVGYNNGHLSALGYERLALDYISYISYVMANNATLFRNIQFIGTNHTY